jgi:predicted negative regulator of RcsB-dependent stress response
MAYDLQEQEQIEELKAWWKQYGNLVILAVIGCALAVAALQGWRHYGYTRSAAAAALYEQIDQAEQAGDRKKVREVAARILEGYGTTPYGVFAALSAARASFESGDLAEARSRLAWAVEHAREDAVRDIARLRLAGVLLDEKNHAEALKLMEIRPSEAMTALYADLRGDILLAQGNRAEARSAYQLALDRSEASSPYRATIEIKLDSLSDQKQ